MSTVSAVSLLCSRGQADEHSVTRTPKFFSLHEASARPSVSCSGRLARAQLKALLYDFLNR